MSAAERCAVVYAVRGYGFGHAARALRLLGRTAGLRDSRTQGLRDSGARAPQGTAAPGPAGSLGPCVPASLGPCVPESFGPSLVSYAEGGALWQRSGLEHVALDLPPVPRPGEAAQAFFHLFRQLRPSVVIADEEFGALEAAACLGLPALLIANWLPCRQLQGARDYTESLAEFQRAQRVLVVDEPEGHEVPPGLPPTRFVGPVTAALDVPPAGARPNGQVLLAFGASKPEDAELGRLLVQELGAGRPEGAGGPMGHVEYLASLRGARAVVTRGTFQTLWDLVFLGVPAIAVPRVVERNPYAAFYAENMTTRGLAVAVSGDTPEEWVWAAKTVVGDEALLGSVRAAALARALCGDGAAACAEEVATFCRETAGV